MSFLTSQSLYQKDCLTNSLEFALLKTITNKSLLTKKDISLLLETFKSVFATKKDLKQFTTKAELEKFRQEVYEKFEDIEGQIKGLSTKG